MYVEWIPVLLTHVGIKLLEDQNSPPNVDCLPTFHVTGM